MRAPIITHKRRGLTNQRFRVQLAGATPFGTPVSNLKPIHSPGKCADIGWADTQPGGLLIQHPCIPDARNQQFFILPSNDSVSSYRIIARHN